MIPILYVSAGIFHPGWPHRFYLRALLARSPGVHISGRSSLEQVSAGEYEQARALVLYVHAKKISPPALARLEAFLNRGGGLVAVHSAAASFKGEPRFETLLGGRFSRHGAVGRFSVQPGPGQEFNFSVQSPFWLRDERYLHETCADIRVCYTSIQGGAPEPFAWTRRQGAGRVFYCAAGHTLAGLRHPSVQQILLDGLSWAAEVSP